jgi:hypothetical protein
VTDPRAVRIAENEARFRDINDRMEQDLRGVVDIADKLALVCECGHHECTELVHMRVADYEAVRADSTHFVIVPGHEITDVEHVIEAREGYLVVEKVGLSAVIADKRDPRKG